MSFEKMRHSTSDRPSRRAAPGAFLLLLVTVALTACGNSALPSDIPSAVGAGNFGSGGGMAAGGTPAGGFNDGSGISPEAEIAGQAAPYTGPGTIEKSTYDSGSPTTGTLDYLTYTPTSYSAAKAAPLIIVVHGCNTTAEQMIASSGLHPMAEREGIVLAYPDVPLSSLPTRCWKWFDPNSQVRDSGDPALIAGVTREVMQKRNVDPQRVYILGMSSGAMMTGIMGATYPDLYTAIGENAGCAYKAGPECAFVGASSPNDMQGQDAYRAMGSHARVMPVLQLRGDADTTVPISNSPRVVAQWIATNNYVRVGAATGPFDTTPDRVVTGQKLGGYKWERRQHLDAAGCLVLEDWTVFTMGHFFSGGSSDPAQAEYTDPKGPVMGEIAWRFFNRYRLDDFRAGYRPSPAACRD